MKTAWLGLIVIMTAFSGCFDFLDPDEDGQREVSPPEGVVDPDSYSIAGVKVHGRTPDMPRNDPLTIRGLGGVNLSAVIYEPVTTDTAPDGSAIAFPTVVFLHGWGTSKEMWQEAQIDEPGAQPSPDDPTAPAGTVNLLDRFARAGFIAVAYDSRGFGQSEGNVHVAGAPELADLRAVIDYVDQNLHDNGKVGVTGISYGAGLGLRALRDIADVTTVVPHQAWADLYDGLLPGHVPKAEWAAELYASGTTTSHGRLDPIVTEWLGKAVQRTDLATVDAQMGTRSIGDDSLSRLSKPLFVCQGIEETLFPQIGRITEAHAGFTRAHVHRGGHGTLDATCWEKTQTWFEFFLLGRDTRVDSWPALTTVDIDPGRAVVAYGGAQLQETVTDRRYLHAGGGDTGFLVRSPSNDDFTVEQMVLANPFDVPSGISDQLGEPNQPIPEQLRHDPTASFFQTEAFETSEVILGGPKLTLVLDGGAADAGFQVVATLFSVDGESGDTRVLTRGAYAHVPDVSPPINGTVTIPLHWTKATLGAGDSLLLKVGGNDPNVYFQYPTDYSVTFTGSSSLDVPYFEP